MGEGTGLVPVSFRALRVEMAARIYAACEIEPRLGNIGTNVVRVHQVLAETTVRAGRMAGRIEQCPEVLLR